MKPYTEPKAPTEEQLANHERLLLWDEAAIPFHIQNEEKGLRPTIRAYLVDGAEAAVVIFPGGGYHALSEDGEGVAVARAYNAAGFSAFVVNYRYEPYDGRAILGDGRRAMQYVRYFAERGCLGGLKPDKIALCGFSAGGHLTMLVAEHPAEENLAGDAVGETRSTPDACILVYPVTTFCDGTYPPMPRIFLGERKEDKALLAKYSYPHRLDAMPPTFVCYSLKDDGVNCEKNGLAMYRAMKAAGMDAELREYTDAGHGCGLGEGFPDFARWHGESVTFLRRREF